jgi:hypothetical protein
MNYLEIVLQGYFNENNRECLEDYFCGEFKKAEKEKFCSADLFFGGCMKIIDILNNNFQEQIFEQQHQLNQYLISAGANKNEVFVKDFKEQIEFQKLNGNTNLRLKNGTIIHLKKDEIMFIETAISGANSLLKILPPPLPENNYTNKIWFKVGLLFATGEMQKLLKEPKANPTNIAEKLNNKGYNKYILATSQNYKETNTDKNIYAHSDKLQKIYTHCKENNISMVEDFLKHIKSIEI